jgi:8-oxo-dGTP diphosphatase
MNTKSKNYDATKYDRPSVTVDVLLFTIDSGELKLLLVKRNREPFRGSWALPGGFVKMDEPIDEAAERELYEETGVKDVYLEQLYTFGDLKRDPRTRVITVTYLALSDNKNRKLRSTGDAREASFFAISKLPELAFDHEKIIKYGVERLRNKIGYSSIAFGLLPEIFTLTELQKVYEVIMGTKIDKRNFRKKILSSELLRATANKSTGGAHRPALLYRFQKRELQNID